MSAVPGPPTELDALAEELPAGARLYRVLRAAPGRDATTFNPGHGHNRFSFFGDPPVPTLYAAQTETAAVRESLLRDVPLRGGVLLPEQYRDCVAAVISPLRPLSLAAFHGVGLRRLGIEPGQLTDTPARDYPRTVAWVEAAHSAGFDGLVWMSRRCTTDRAYVLFGDRVSREELQTATDYARIFAAGEDLDWLIDVCATAGVDVLV